MSIIHNVNVNNTGKLTNDTRIIIVHAVYYINGIVM